MTRQFGRWTGFLADTWWFGLTRRLSAQDFEALADLRAEQGFSAVQLVVGVPPEVGPENANAQSEMGAPWTLEGEFNRAYLRLARRKIQHLNNLGFLVIVYGAWGHQIDWLGRERMLAWWLRIIETLDSLSVIYCLCGESNLWVGEATRLLPAKSTGDLTQSQLLALLPSPMRGICVGAIKHLKSMWHGEHYRKRREDWSSVLAEISQKTDKPIILHPMADETGFEAVTNPELLAANTAQTGHDPAARNRLWQLPLALLERDPAHRGFINLEPWYEGIRDRFWARDQMFAYWVTMLAGASSYCYGAHGIWNVGDGEFLAHWGKQTNAQARALDTPRLLGLSHTMFSPWRGPGETFFETRSEELVTIGRTYGTSQRIQFFPDVAEASRIPDGKIWLPLQGAFAERLPEQGQAVIFVE